MGITRVLLATPPPSERRLKEQERCERPQTAHRAACLHPSPERPQGVTGWLCQSSSTLQHRAHAKWGTHAPQSTAPIGSGSAWLVPGLRTSRDPHTRGVGPARGHKASVALVPGHSCTTGSPPLTLFTAPQARLHAAELKRCCCTSAVLPRHKAAALSGLGITWRGPRTAAVLFADSADGLEPSGPFYT